MIARRDLLRHSVILAALMATPAAAKGGERPLAALLLPLTGSSADLARSLHRAAELALPGGADMLAVFDTGTTPGGAAAAAAAVRRGAPLLIGPVFAAQAGPAVTVARGVPMIALSNDNVGTGPFILGVIPAQAVGAILGCARARGIRRVAVAPGGLRWELLAIEAAQRAARDLGLTLTDAASADAVLVSGDADAFAAAARSLAGSGVQLLVTHQGMALSGAGRAAADGAWIAAPDPDGFADFARRFETAYGNPPGLLAGLAYDAVGIARTLRTAGHVDRDGLTASAGFPGVGGAVRFRADGLAARELAIVVVENGGFRVVAHSQPA